MLTHNNRTGHKLNTDLYYQDKFKLIVDRNRQLLAELRRQLAVMAALKHFIQRRFEAKKGKDKVLHD